MIIVNVYLLYQEDKQIQLECSNTQELCELIILKLEEYKLESNSFYLILDTGEKITQKNITEINLIKDSYDVLLIVQSSDKRMSNKEIASSIKPSTVQYDYITLLSKSIPTQQKIYKIIISYFQLLKSEYESNLLKLNQYIIRYEVVYSQLSNIKKLNSQVDREKEIITSISYLETIFKIKNINKILDSSFLIKAQDEFLDEYRIKKEELINWNNKNISIDHIIVKGLSGQENEMLRQIKEYKDKAVVSETNIINLLDSKFNSNKANVMSFLEIVNDLKIENKNIKIAEKQINKRYCQVALVEELKLKQDLLLVEFNKRNLFDYYFEEIINFFNSILVTKEMERRKKFNNSLSPVFKCEYSKIIINSLFNLMGKYSNVENDLESNKKKDKVENMLIKLFEYNDYYVNEDSMLVKDNNKYIKDNKEVINKQECISCKEKDTLLETNNILISSLNSNIINISNRILDLNKNTCLLLKDIYYLNPEDNDEILKNYDIKHNDYSNIKLKYNIDKLDESIFILKSRLKVISDICYEEKASK